MVVRFLRNQIAPQTVKEIDRRIKEHIEYRGVITSDKALYLSMFRTVFGILNFLCMGASTFILSFFSKTPEGPNIIRLGSIAMFLLTSLVCSFSMRTTLLDSKEKLESHVAKIDGKIEKLRDSRAKLVSK